MDVLHAMAGDGAAEGTAVVADEQSEGRGSRGRVWRSPRGGLWLSVLLRPRSASGLDLLSLRAGLAVAQALSASAPGAPIRLKWPNDLMLDHRKVGGMLCEARWQGDVLGWVVVGLGLNVTNPTPGELEDIAGNLATRLPGRSPAELAEPLANVIRAIDTRSSRLTAEEVERFRALDWLFGRAVRRPSVGVGDGIDPDGALRLRLRDGGNITLRAGPVELAESSLGA